jgi:hypothetical protein
LRHTCCTCNTLSGSRLLALCSSCLALHCSALRRQHGDLFWSDFWWNAWVNASIYSVMGGMQKPPWENKPSFRLADSGQMLFDRLRHAEVRTPR